jgi:hypothetical protein
LLFLSHDDGAADGDHNAGYGHHNDAEHYEAENVNYDNYYQSNHEYQHTDEHQGYYTEEAHTTDEHEGYYAEEAHTTDIAFQTLIQYPRP